MDELAFIREYVAVMCCTEQSALHVFILYEALQQEAEPEEVDKLIRVPADRLADALLAES